ncbi:MAG: glutathione S-transferase family protein [Ramlibacter sp.]
MLTVHHLGTSQSERILWLCEELGVPYELKRHERDAVTRLSPPELLALHPMGTAPVIVDEGLVLGESGAIVDYIIAKYGGERLAPGPAHPDHAAYLYWFHFSNATFQPLMGRNMHLHRLALPADHPLLRSTRGRLDRALALLEERLAGSFFLAGAELTAADIMIVFSLTTMRLFYPLDLSPHPAIRAYLGRIGKREAYRRAMAKGDPGLAPLLA